MPRTAARSLSAPQPLPILRDDESGPRPKIVGARRIRKYRTSIARLSMASVVLPPDSVLVLENGTAFACYQGEPFLRFSSLERLLAEYDLDERDLSE